jgi:hypothetical protein
MHAWMKWCMLTVQYLHRNTIWINPLVVGPARSLKAIAISYAWWIVDGSKELHANPASSTYAVVLIDMYFDAFAPIMLQLWYIFQSELGPQSAKMRSLCCTAAASPFYAARRGCPTQEHRVTFGAQRIQFNVWSCLRESCILSAPHIYYSTFYFHTFATICFESAYNTRSYVQCIECIVTYAINTDFRHHHN